MQSKSRSAKKSSGPSSPSQVETRDGQSKLPNLPTRLLRFPREGAERIIRVKLPDAVLAVLKKVARGAGLKPSHLIELAVAWAVGHTSARIEMIREQFESAYPHLAGQRLVPLLSKRGTNGQEVVNVDAIKVMQQRQERRAA